MAYMKFLKHVEKYTKGLDIRKLAAVGGVVVLILMGMVGLWILSGNPTQNTTDARAALVGLTAQQGPGLNEAVGEQDGARLSPEAGSTPVTVESTPIQAAPTPTTVEPTAIPVAPTPPTSPFAPPATRGGVRIPAATVAIDPGHGGWDSGAVYQNPGGGTFTEKEVALQVGLRVQKLLVADGLKVVMTRTSDVSVGGSPKGAVGADLQARIDIANAANADVLVSIHFNSSGSPTSQGTETLYNANRPFSAQNQRLAQNVNSALLASMRAAGYASQNRGVKTDQSTGRGQFYLLSSGSTRPSRMPAVIGEGLFISNPTEAALLKQPEFLDTLAQGYADAIMAYFAR